MYIKLKKYVLNACLSIIRKNVNYVFFGRKENRANKEIFLQ